MSSRTADSRNRPAKGPALFRQGFRPFFLGAGLWGLAALPLWLLAFQGKLILPTAFAPLAWHAHEMIFGFGGAVVAGFLLTAIPNWTGRLPLQGPPLALLFALWIAGRLVMAVSAEVGAGTAAIFDLAFPAALLAFALREIIAGRNWRNLPLMAALGLLIVANALTHLEALGLMATGPLGERLGLAVLVQLICLVGGRIIPSFTRNWLVKRDAAALPAAFGIFDKVCLIVTATALTGWVALPDRPAVSGLLLVAGALHLLRLARWQPLRTFSEPLVWSLHLGFLWVPLGLLLLGGAKFAPAWLPATAGLHALGAGAVGGMTLAVMTRATLGHSGRALRADAATAVIYLAIAAAAVLRVIAAVLPDAYLTLLWLSGLAWTLAFALFVIVYGRIHLSK